MPSSLHGTSPWRSRCALQLAASRWLALALGLFAMLGCETSDATYAVVSNGFEGPAPPVVYKAWWSVALFREPILAGQSSDAVRIVRGTDYAYALLAPNWDASSGAAPSALVAVRSNEPFSAKRGDLLQISLSDLSTTGNCASGSTLSAEDASFITERIFPGEFAGATYNPETCSSLPKEDGGSP
ncbi:MAG TPA: hypothetical protein VG963_12150 [Polyangiaceae bacterium]|nr:hypothetical protein [Polyangiaceae bacterium]